MRVLGTGTCTLVLEYKYRLFYKKMNSVPVLVPMFQGFTSMDMSCVIRHT